MEIEVVFAPLVVSSERKSGAAETEGMDFGAVLLAALEEAAAQAIGSGSNDSGLQAAPAVDAQRGPEADASWAPSPGTDFAVQDVANGPKATSAPCPNVGQAGWTWPAPLPLSALMPLVLTERPTEVPDEGAKQGWTEGAMGGNPVVSGKIEGREELSAAEGPAGPSAIIVAAPTAFQLEDPGSAAPDRRGPMQAPEGEAASRRSAAPRGLDGSAGWPRPFQPVQEGKLLPPAATAQGGGPWAEGADAVHPSESPAAEPNLRAAAARSSTVSAPEKQVPVAFTAEVKDEFRAPELETASAGPDDLPSGFRAGRLEDSQAGVSSRSKAEGRGDTSAATQDPGLAKSVDRLGPRPRDSSWAPVEADVSREPSPRSRADEGSSDRSDNPEIKATSSAVSQGLDRTEAPAHRSPESPRAAEARPPAAQVAQAVRICVATGGDRVTVHLEPESLGKIHVLLTRDPTGVAAHFRVENPDTFQAFQAELPSLRHALESRGVPLVQVFVELDQGEGRGREFFSHRSDRRPRRSGNGSLESQTAAEPGPASAPWKPWAFDARI